LNVLGRPSGTDAFPLGFIVREVLKKILRLEKNLKPVVVVATPAAFLKSCISFNRKKKKKTNSPKIYLQSKTTNYKQIKSDKYKIKKKSFSFRRS